MFDRSTISRSCTGFSLPVAACAIVAIVISGLGLANRISPQAVNITSLITSFGNPITGIVQFIISILGLTGNLSCQVVSGVTLGCAALTLMVASVMNCCLVSIACCAACSENN